MRQNNRLLYPRAFHEGELLSARARAPFDEHSLAFLNEVSKRMLKDPRSRRFSDVVTLAFWIRKANTQKLKREYIRGNSGELVLGRGVVFHIAPGNVAANFAYSLFTSVLAGNNNIVKLAPREFPQTDIIVDAIVGACDMPEYADIAAGTVIVRYGVDDEKTELFSSLCDVRVIWGGDETVKTIRQYPLPPRSSEIMFADRYSFCAVKASAVLDSPDLSAAALGFYNDTYLMDQNACSSPRMVVWQGAPRDVCAAKKKFWGAVRAVVTEKYEMEPIFAVDKYERALRDAVNYPGVRKEEEPDNLITRIFMPDVPGDVETIRSPGGYFVETTVSDLSEIARVVTKKYQTMTYFGFSSGELSQFVRENALRGIDRFVPFGKALDFGLIWDGYDLITELSRVCSIT